MNNLIKIRILREKLIKEINKDLLKKNGIFENLGKKQLREFEEVLKSGNFGHYYLNKLYNEVDILRNDIYKIDDNYFKKLKGDLNK